jgi:hypothetical protein
MTNPTKTVAKNAAATNKRNAAKFAYRSNSRDGFTLQSSNGELFTKECEETVVVLNHAEALELAQALLVFVANAEAL